MIQIKCDKCSYEFAITKNKCPKCGDPVKVLSKFYCGDCENELDVEKGICSHCNKRPQEIIVVSKDGNRVRTEFDTEDSNMIDNENLNFQDMDFDNSNDRTTNVKSKESTYPKEQDMLNKDFAFLFICQIIGIGFFIYLFIIRESFFNFYSIPFLVLLYFGKVESIKGTKRAGQIGLVTGFLMMLTIIQYDIADFLLGLFLVIHSNKYLNNMTFK